MPAGSHVIHYAKGVHYDGAKDEPATILVWGEGPATSTPFVGGGEHGEEVAERRAQARSLPLKGAIRKRVQVRRIGPGSG